MQIVKSTVNYSTCLHYETLLIKLNVVQCQPLFIHINVLYNVYHRVTYCVKYIHSVSLYHKPY